MVHPRRVLILLGTVAYALGCSLGVRFLATFGTPWFRRQLWLHLGVCVLLSALVGIANLRRRDLIVWFACFGPTLALASVYVGTLALGTPPLRSIDVLAFTIAPALVQGRSA